MACGRLSTIVVSVPIPVTALVTGIQLPGVRSGFCCKANPEKAVGQARNTVFVDVRTIRSVGDERGGVAALKAANCINQAPELKVAVALY